MNNLYTTDDVLTLMELFHITPYINDSHMCSHSSLLKEGIVFVQNNTICKSVPAKMADIALDRFAVSNELWSRSFHKSWDKVANADYTELVEEQLIHYFSTYGLESLGFQAIPIIPVEKVIADPEARPNFNAFTVIKIVSDEEVVSYIDSYLKVNKAPAGIWLKDIVNLMRFTTINIDDIASYELKAARYDQLNIVPQDGENFLRFIIYKLTGSTLLIKNEETVQNLRNAAVYKADELEKWFKASNLIKLSEAFYRFKPLWLALKVSSCSWYVNKMRRLAVNHHKPLNDVNVQNISKLYSEGRLSDVLQVLRNCSMRQLIKLYNHFAAPTSNVYNIRNGKIWVNKEAESNDYSELLSLIHRNLITRLYGSKQEEVYLIPSYIKYAVPVSEKQFVDNIPYGSRISLGSGRATFAVYWENYNNQRTDLDLHMRSLTQSYGWNSLYRSEDRGVLYSGDMTDASKGAVEAYNIDPKSDNYFLTINNYTHYTGTPFKFFITRQWNKNNDNRAVVDVKDALFSPVPLKFSKSDGQSIGIIADGYFYFYGGDVSKSNCPTDCYTEVLSGLLNKLPATFTVNELLELSGAKIVDENSVNALTEEEKDRLIDLSPSELTARSLLDLID